MSDDLSQPPHVPGRRSGRAGALRGRGAVLAVAASAVVTVAAWAVAAPRSFHRDAPRDACFVSEPDRCFVSHGAYVMLSGAVTRDRAAVDRVIGRALAYWSAPAGLLDRWLVTYEDHEIECNGERASGCTSWRRGTLRLQVLDPRCPETAQLVHELGHVVLHDPGHRDGRWCREAEQEATRASVRAADASPGCGGSGYYTGPVAAEHRCDGPSGPGVH